MRLRLDGVVQFHTLLWNNDSQSDQFYSEEFDFCTEALKNNFNRRIRINKNSCRCKLFSKIRRRKKEKKKKSSINSPSSRALTSQKNRITRGARSNIKLSNSTPSPIRDHTIVRSSAPSLEHRFNRRFIRFKNRNLVLSDQEKKKKKKSSANIEIAFHDLPRDTRRIGWGEKKWNKKKKRGKKRKRMNARTRMSHKKKKKKFLHNCTTHLRLFVRGMKHDASCIGRQLSAQSC